jgi:predicted DNA-binding transcriptional regulator AlpA
VTKPPSAGAPLDRIISERIAAEILGISADTLRRLSGRNEGPLRRKISPRRIGYKVSEVEAYRDGKLQSAAIPQPRRAFSRKRIPLKERARRRRPRSSR